jgi:hypothetical protein
MTRSIRAAMKESKYAELTRTGARQIILANAIDEMRRVGITDAEMAKALRFVADMLENKPRPR